ncbi:LEAF RUST 10 DISEASE-RESISTANCE LOCUS RECEPTOR-LIKE PROTEIN KINASE-like 1.2 isoform X1 [Morus notabilis]|uniref:LEAF RUST 10 DISEASE-RESISTANCE LOCUS RECEPTOR-LIKE PROTEIN KINASE-like 1.2 isoform X1 n=1 Tax=Morus notabilis TaxID=981085 RepID=UPI000CED5CBC|nr:LEAF RUST 10 DISEASE-RESISTANCE LOCUS RECEPTOR-LIKE PROTEIN KINASE-like 1.2 isoform X1 [Morus notabilis]
MNPSVSFSFSPLLLILLLLFLSSFFPIRAVDDDQDNPFPDCKLYCGEIKRISYPFRERKQPDYCSVPQGFVLDCESNTDRLLWNITSQSFLVLEINQSARILKIARVDIWDSICPETHSNTTLNSTLFNYTQKDINTTLLYNCHNSPESLTDLVKTFHCSANNVSLDGFFVRGTDLGSHKLSSSICAVIIVVPVLEDALKGLTISESSIGKVSRDAFEVEWNTMGEEECGDCINSDGRCGYNSSTDQDKFMCLLCPDDREAYGLSCVAPASVVYPAQMPDAHKNSSGRDWKLKTGIGIGGGFVGILLMSIIFYIYQRRKRKQSAPRSLLSRDISSDISSVKDVEKGSSYHGVHLFTYEELVEATSCFDSTKELGDGGFGTVYYGKLRDGRVVAVKRLYENNFRRVEQFMNEVEILAHLRHKNLVSLYGCTSRHSHELLLVYEYIPNGTVADHLHGERAKPGALPWAIRLNIAVETASALKYLHASDVIHRDVKSTNILLDNNFSVKVADFGLSRLFPTHVTHVSTAPQGTPGYVDPEYHQCYQLTSKSDVFSFGVVLMELVSSLPAVDITRHRHDINLSTMAMNRILNHALHELVDPSLGFDTDPRVRKMITAVAELAFQCLQQDKDLRPCMVAVLDGLMAIQSGDYSTDNTERIDSAADETVLLKKGPLSPDSVAINWDSRITTPNASG